MSLTNPVTTLSGVGEKYAKKLEKLGIFTVYDLIFHIPHRYLDFSKVAQIKNIQIDETYTITGTITEIKNTYTRRHKKITTATVQDETGSIQLVWFNQVFLTKVLFAGDRIRASGKVSWWDRKRAIIAPVWKKIDEGEPAIGDILPIYPETEGVQSNWLTKIVKSAWQKNKHLLVETLHESILHDFNLPTLVETLETLHFPTDLTKTEQARYRLAFEEVFSIQKESQKRRMQWNNQPAPFVVDMAKHNDGIINFIAKLPFTLTDAQHRVAKHLLTDLSKNRPMNRLLQGDVGSGKTVIAAIGAYIAHLHGYKTVILAPTEVLAQQHASTLQELFKEHALTIAIVTGSTKTDEFHAADIIVGTHALFNQKDTIERLGLLIVDEQHKFGVEQRAQLVTGQKITPHVLAMTATPIPRSIALTLYGDQDLSVIDELPPGRLPVKTWVVPQIKRQDSYNWIREQISRMNGSPQAIIVYPLINESEHETLTDVKAATSEFERLQKEFGSLRLALIHGRLPAKQKNQIIDQFRSGNIDILVTTSVVEVGIDAPSASIIVIENAERFGLSTLHQLRGRVGRRGQQGYCFLFTATDDDLTLTRLKAMETHHNGLELAEIDLKLRGPGQLFGTKQHGVGELRFAEITNIKLIEDTRKALEIATYK